MSGGVSLPQADAGVSTIFAQHIVRHIHEPQLVHVAVVIADDALQRLDTSLLRRHAVPHVFDNRMSYGDFDVFSPAAGRARRTYVLIGIAASANDGRIATASREFECQTACCRDTRHLSLFIQNRAVNGAGGWE